VEAGSDFIEIAKENQLFLIKSILKELKLQKQKD
jgi:hypothetical protein